MNNPNRIIDANLNRASEAARILEEITRFLLDDEKLSTDLKNIRHKINSVQNEKYEQYLEARDTENDIGTEIKNNTKRLNLYSVFKANIKRLQQALRTLAEYSPEHYDIFEKLRYTSYTLEKNMWNKLKEQYNRIKISEKKLYLVTNSDNFKSEDDFLNAIAASLAGGVDIVQLREKNMPAFKIVDLGKKIKQLCLQYDATFIVNDRVDIALALEADGVHLGQEDLDIKTARSIMGENAIIGISVQTPEQATKAVMEGADYIGAGPVFSTPTKTDCPTVRKDFLEWISKNISLPVFAIGGINLDTLEDIMNNGIKRVAIVRAVLNADDPTKAAKEFLKRLNNEN